MFCLLGSDTAQHFDVAVQMIDALCGDLYGDMISAAHKVGRVAPVGACHGCAAIVAGKVFVCILGSHSSSSGVVNT